MEPNEHKCENQYEHEYHFRPVEGLDLVYSRITLPSYLDDDRYENIQATVEGCIKFELGLTRELRIPICLDKKEGVIGFDIVKLQKFIDEQLGVTISDDLSSFSLSCLKKLKPSELCLTEKVLSFHRDAVPSAVEETDQLPLLPPPIKITQSTNDEWSCSICLCILINPTTLKCGHTCCRECIQPLLNTKNPSQRICPLCRDPIPSNCPLLIDTAIQSRVQSMFAQDREYLERQQEVADQNAERDGITVYKLPVCYLKGHCQATATSSVPLATTASSAAYIYPALAVKQAAQTRRLAEEELRRVLKCIFSLRSHPSSCSHFSLRENTATPFGFSPFRVTRLSTKQLRYLRFYHSVTVSDLDSVRKGSMEGKGVPLQATAAEIITAQVTQHLAAGHPLCLSSGQAPSAAGTSECNEWRERVKNTLFPRLLHSIGMTGDASFFDLCDMLLISFMTQVIDDVSTTAASAVLMEEGEVPVPSTDKKEIDVDIVTADAVLDTVRALPAPPSCSSPCRGVAPYGQGGLCGIRFVLAPAILDLCASLSSREAHFHDYEYEQENEHKGREEQEPAALSTPPPLSLWERACSHQKCAVCLMANPASALRCVCCDSILLLRSPQAAASMPPQTSYKLSSYPEGHSRKNERGADMETAKDNEGEWTCPSCTFLNCSSFAPVTCSICEQTRPPSTSTCGNICPPQEVNCAIEEEGGEGRTSVTPAVYLSSAAVSVLNDMLVESIDSLICATQLHLQSNLEQPRHHQSDLDPNLVGVGEVPVAYAAGPVTLQRASGSSKSSNKDSTVGNKDIEKEDDTGASLLNVPEECVCLAPAPSLSVLLRREHPGTWSTAGADGRVVLLTDIKAAVDILFPDALGRTLHHAMAKALRCYARICCKLESSSFPTLHPSPVRPISTDWTQHTGLLFCPPHIALIVNTLLQYGDRCGMVRNKIHSLTVEATIGVTAIAETLCLVLLSAARDHMQSRSDNGGGTNYIMPSDVEAAKDMQGQRWLRGERKLRQQEKALPQRGAEEHEQKAETRLCSESVFDLRSVFPGYTLTPSCSSFCSLDPMGSIPNTDAETNTPTQASFFSSSSSSSSSSTTTTTTTTTTFDDALRHVATHDLARVFVSPLTGNHLQVLTHNNHSTPNGVSTSLRRHPLLDAASALSAPSRRAAVHSVAPTPPWILSPPWQVAASAGRTSHGADQRQEVEWDQKSIRVESERLELSLLEPGERIVRVPHGFGGKFDRSDFTSLVRTLSSRKKAPSQWQDHILWTKEALQALNVATETYFLNLFIDLRQQLHAAQLHQGPIQKQCQNQFPCLSKDVVRLSFSSGGAGRWNQRQLVLAPHSRCLAALALKHEKQHQQQRHETIHVQAQSNKSKTQQLSNGKAHPPLIESAFSFSFSTTTTTTSSSIPPLNSVSSSSTFPSASSSSSMTGPSTQGASFTPHSSYGCSFESLRISSPPAASRPMPLCMNTKKKTAETFSAIPAVVNDPLDQCQTLISPHAAQKTGETRTAVVSDPLEQCQTLISPLICASASVATASSSEVPLFAQPPANSFAFSFGSLGSNKSSRKKVTAKRPGNNKK